MLCGGMIFFNEFHVKLCKIPNLLILYIHIKAGASLVNVGFLFSLSVIPFAHLSICLFVYPSVWVFFLNYIIYLSQNYDAFFINVQINWHELLHNWIVTWTIKPIDEFKKGNVFNNIRGPELVFPDICLYLVGTIF